MAASWLFGAYERRAARLGREGPAIARLAPHRNRSWLDRRSRPASALCRAGFGAGADRGRGHRLGSIEAARAAVQTARHDHGPARCMNAAPVPPLATLTGDNFLPTRVDVVVIGGRHCRRRRCLFPRQERPQRRPRRERPCRRRAEQPQPGLVPHPEPRPLRTAAVASRHGHLGQPGQRDRHRYRLPPLRPDLRHQERTDFTAAGMM